MMRGYAAIGLVRPKSPGNVGGAMRAAHCYGASMVAIESDRTSGKYFMGSPLDTPNAWKHIPTLHTHNLRELVPHGCVPVAVDLVEGAVALPSFQHPARAFYVFGPEDGTLGRRHLDWCAHKVMIPMRGCSNLAATVNVILYDRLAKAERYSRGIRNSDLVETAA
ncbi:RNA methyltransferase [Mesorhizobium silamurunense]|uniref:RNA methyltransferase n=1 Tax=Mesorhizobium silamurunense TaxID=499528 RepID=UPI001783A638|nr:RNA methyltransferase [Mesorhizobium silamurunense]